MFDLDSSLGDGCEGLKKGHLGPHSYCKAAANHGLLAYSEHHVIRFHSAYIVDFFFIPLPHSGGIMIGYRCFQRVTMLISMLSEGSSSAG